MRGTLRATHKPNPAFPCSRAVAAYHKRLNRDKPVGARVKQQKPQKFKLPVERVGGLSYTGRYA